MAVQGCVNDLIGSPVSGHAEQPVNQNRQHAAQGQQENQPHVLTSHMGHEVQGMVEERPQKAAQDAHQRAKQALFQKRLYIVLRMMQFVKPSHGISSFCL